VTNLDDINDRNLGAAMWATNDDERFEDFDTLHEEHRQAWIEQAQALRALLSVVLADEKRAQWRKQPPEPVENLVGVLAFPHQPTEGEPK
jgi:hypothetical protein